jgi:alanyl-tRNA synthetase
LTPVAERRRLAPMTERLYYADSYLTEFDATVVGRDGERLYLDRSAFYPTSGGQPFDVGVLRSAAEAAPLLRVVDVVDEGERVAHVLAPDSLGPENEADLAVGARLHGQLTWSRRFDHMQQHTGQHLLSAVFEEQLGLSTVSVHFGAEVATLDLDTSALTAEQLATVEDRANALVFENRPITASVEEDPHDLRKQSARTGALRVVSIAALDRSACGGTHVARTGEIGPILLGKVERVRKSARVEFVCGGRAIRRARETYQALTRLGVALSTSVDSVADVVTTRLAALERDAAALRKARESLDGYRAAELYGAVRERVGGALALEVERQPRGTVQDYRGLAQSYARHPRAVFLVAIEEPAALLLACSEDSGVDAGATLKAALAAGGGRGGGSARLAQASFETPAALAAALSAIVAHVTTAG